MTASARKRTRKAASTPLAAVTREAWLQAAVDHLRPDFEAVGAPLPAAVYVSVGFTSKGMRSRAIGQAWSGVCSSDDVCHVFIVPSIDDGLRALDILVHELVHVAVGVEHGHKKPFAVIARALGLEGKLTATVAGESLKGRLAEIVQVIGEYPHAALTSTAGAKTQTTRMLKVVCREEDDGCGCVVRMTAKWIDTTGCPTCACGVPMSLED